MHQLLEECQPVHAWHLDVQCKDIGSQREYLIPGDVGIGSRADNLQVRLRRQRLGQDLAHDGGVVDHQNPNLVSAQAHEG